MNFLSTSSPSSSSSFNYRTTYTTAPSHNHHGGGGTSVSDDAGDKTEDVMMMPLFSRSDNNTTTEDTNTHTTTIPASLVEKEHMFDKVVTPSDVGKLNRLVIPKQYAEKYFPLDSSTNEKGLLLNFEDRNGKPWRFRYSYWNSSQSYVMTKGWSRFVKEKKLDAGDIVSFQRGSGESDKDRLFIDWRRRPDASELMNIPSSSIPLHHHQFAYHRSLNPWTNTNNPMFLQPPNPPPPHYNHHYGGGGFNTTSPNYGFNNHTTIVNGNPCPPGSILYLRSGVGVQETGFYGPQVLQLQRSGGNNIGGGSGIIPATFNDQHQPMVFDSVPVVQGKAAAKRLRLFGVNMDCPINDPDGYCHDVLSSTATLAHSTMPMLHNFGVFDSSSSSSVNPSLQLRSYNDEDDDHDKGKGNTSMSLDLDI